MILTKEQWQNSSEPYNPGDYVETLDAQAHTIAELTAKLEVRGRIIDQQNAERIKINEENQRNYNAVTAKLDAVRSVAEHLKKKAWDDGICRDCDLDEQADELLSILDAPTKPKEAEWQCEVCHSRYAEYINGCPHCWEAGLRSKVTKPKEARK